MFRRFSLSFAFICAHLLFLSNLAHADLLAHYAFNGDATDSSGNGNDAMGAGGVDFTQPGFTGNAGDFAANFDAGGEVVIAPAAAFQSMSTNNSATVSLWQFGDAGQQPRNDTIFSFNNSGNRQFMSHAPWGNGTVYFDTGGCCGGTQRQTTNPATSEYEGQWNHYLYVKDGNNKQLWINGTLRINQVGGATSGIGGFNEAAIGAERNNATNNYRGLIDDFGIWDEGLNSAEAQAVFNMATQPELQYGVSEADMLFNLFDSGMGELEIADLTWTNTTGLMGNEGSVVDLGGGQFGLILDANGNGLLGAPTPVPEPATLAVWCLLGLGLIALRRRKR